MPKIPLFRPLLVTSLALVVGSIHAADPAPAAPAPVLAEAPAGDVKSDGQRVLGQLDLGGDVLFYLNTRGDGPALGRRLNELLAQLREGGDAGIPQIDCQPFTRALGLDSIYGLGLSSAWDASRGLYRTRMVLDMPMGPEGLLKFYGTKNESFSVSRLAPENAAVVLEGEVRWTALRDVVTDIATQVMGETGKGMIQGFLDNAIAGGPTGNDWLQGLSTRTQFVGVITRENERDRLDFWCRFAGAGALVDGVIKMQAQMPQIGLAEAPDFTVVSLPMHGQGGLERLVLLRDKTSNDLLLASDTSFVRRCLALNKSLADTADYKSHTAGLPAKGVLFAYVGPEYNRWALESAARETAADGDQTGVVFARMLAELLAQPTAQVVERTPTGFVSTQYSKVSLKTYGAVAAIALPVALAMEQNKRSQPVEEMSNLTPQEAIQQNLRDFAMAGQQHMLEHGVPQATYADIVGEGLYLNSLESYAGESYADLVVSQEGGLLRVTTSEGETIEIEY